MQNVMIFIIDLNCEEDKILLFCFVNIYVLVVYFIFRIFI